jgi:glutamate-5-semialdehyde dehydrogenase
LERSLNQIRQANELDLKAASELESAGKISKALLERLKLDRSKLRSLLDGIDQLAKSEDSIGKSTWGMQLDHGLELYRVNCPIGVIGVIFESRPDVLPQIISLCLRTGNACILKGGSEARCTNEVLFALIVEAVAEVGIPIDSLALLETRAEVDQLLKLDGLVDLIIPRGSNELVSHIQTNTQIPVLGHAEGICHIYVDKSADLSKAKRIITDAKVQYPSACNSLETLLVHSEIAVVLFPTLIEHLLEYGVELRFDERSKGYLGPGIGGIKSAEDSDWSTEYCDLVLSVKTVDSMEEAITHINRFGSHHTDSMITEDKRAFEQFFATVDSAGVFLNASTRFADGYRYGFGAEVGISTGKLHPRGPVGLDGLITYKYKLLGNGHIVGDYVGHDAKQFEHKPLNAYPLPPTLK